MKYKFEKNRFYRKVLVEPLTTITVKEINMDNLDRKRKVIDIPKREPIRQEVDRANRAKFSNTYKKIDTLNPIFKDKTIFIIGGGPSLLNFDFSVLKDKFVIAINKAFLTYPNADVLYWTDSRFYKWFETDINKFKGLKITNKPRPAVNDIINLRDTGRDGLELKPDGIRHGNNSGYAAINVAIHLGAKNIILLGYDMESKGNKTHFHDGYQIKHNPRIYENNMMPHFNTLIKPLEEKGVKVWNINKDSKLRCFPFCTLLEALNF